MQNDPTLADNLRALLVLRHDSGDRTMTPDAFSAWRDSLPDTHWAKRDLTGCALAWNAAIDEAVSTLIASYARRASPACDDFKVIDDGGGKWLCGCSIDRSEPYQWRVTVCARHAAEALPSKQAGPTGEPAP